MKGQIQTSIKKGDYITNALGTIKGRIITMTSVFLLMLIGFTAAVLIQNRQTQAISENIVNFRLPVTLSANSILSGLNRVSASQRAFILTKDEAFRKERKFVWENQILPDLTLLVNQRDGLSSEKNKIRVDSIRALVTEYKVLQDDIDNFVLENLMVDETAKLETDSSNLTLLINGVNDVRQKRRVLDENIRLKTTPIRNKLRDLLQPLATTNNDFLEAEIRQVTADIEDTNILGIVISICTFLLSIFITFFVIKRLNTSIDKSIGLLDQLSLGIIPPQEEPLKDELNAIINSGNKLSANLKQASEFAQHVGEGDFDVEFTPASNEDLLGNSLIRMRDKLNKVALEESKRKWVNSGHTQIGQILREEYNNLEDWYFNIVSFIVNYLDANQGAIYLIENGAEEDRYVELKACVAYQRKKYQERRLDIKEGLVGRCIFEKASIYLKDLPENYLLINSGLGDAPPKNLILIPLLANDEVVGVLEIASFIIFEDSHIKFLEEISKTVASTVMSVKTNEETKKLLNISREQAEEIQAAEEEMRQNNEELMVTQERLASQEAYLTGKLQAINNTVAIIEFTMDGKIKDANSKFLSIFNYQLRDIKDKHHKMFCDEAYRNSADYRVFWERFKDGEKFSGIVKRKDKSGNTILLHATYHPQYRNNEETPSSVFKVAYEVNKEEYDSLITDENQKIIAQPQ